MSKETKIGLLVGLLFIVVFGLVLSQTASNPKEGEDPSWAKNGGPNGHLPLKPVVPAPLGPGPILPGGHSALDRRTPPVGSDMNINPNPPAGANKKKPLRETYRVQDGDKIDKIMRIAYGPDFIGKAMCDQVLKANNITASRLPTGKVLQLPTLDLKPAPVGGPPIGEPTVRGDDTPARPSGKTYTIASGDTIEKIAKKHCGGVTAVEKILSLNKSLDPRKLKIGTVIKLPDARTDGSVASIH